MKYIIIGGNGFIGRQVGDVLNQQEVELWEADYGYKSAKNKIKMDLSNINSIKNGLLKVKPEIIINCAGTVENSRKALLINPIFTLNLLQAIIASKIKLKKAIFIGSAGEYGIVGESNLPVPEDFPLLATDNYPKSKIIEEGVTCLFRELYNLPIITARIFNPIGPGMHPRFLIPKLVDQIRDYKKGKRKQIEITRLDANRDYIDVRDVASALVMIAQTECSSYIYNIGSGIKTSNKDLLAKLCAAIGIEESIPISETQKKPEPIFAIQADILKIRKEIGWKPKIKLDQTIKDLTNEK